MCGLAGSFGPYRPTPDQIASTRRLLARRGPDADGISQQSLRGHPLTLVHSRLSIIDLDPRSNQPFEHDGCVLVFNGEIYNYIELRDELIATGHTFRTDSDTELIAHAYRRYGPDCVDRFEGMWALALVDRKNDVLFLSRDRFGEKPLFLRTVGGTLFFGSEVKALTALCGQAPTPSLQQVKRFLVNGYKSLYKQPASFFEGVSEFPAGHNALVSDPCAVSAMSFWNPGHNPRAMSMNDAVDGVREHLTEALRIRLRADVPLAFCLSGGLDSTSLAALATRRFGEQIHAFSIVDSDPRYNELANMTKTVEALGCQHHIVHTSTDGFLERMEALVQYHDAPVATISYYVHSFLSEAIADAGYKVALSGTGADELLTGYYDHYAFWLSEMHGSPGFDSLLKDWRDGYGKFVANPVLQNPLVFHENPAERGHIYLNREIFNELMLEPFEEDFFETDFGAGALRNRMLNEMNHEVVPVILKEDDLNSMYFSIENRSPFLDRKLAEFVYSIPGEHLIHDGYQKHLLRAAVAGIVPDEVRLDKQKRGFNASLDSLVDRNDPEIRDRLLEQSPIFDLVDRTKIEGFLGGDMTNNSFSKFMFSFISAKLFLDGAADDARFNANAA